MFEVRAKIEEKQRRAQSTALVRIFNQQRQKDNYWCCTKMFDAVNKLTSRGKHYSSLLQKTHIWVRVRKLKSLLYNKGCKLFFPDDYFESGQYCSFQGFNNAITLRIYLSSNYQASNLRFFCVENIREVFRNKNKFNNRLLFIYFFFKRSKRTVR